MSRESRDRGTVLAHLRGQRASQGHSYKDAYFQDEMLHKIEHGVEGYK
jgi:hypothetical protein